MNRIATLLAALISAIALITHGAEPTSLLPHTRAAWAATESDLGEVDPGLRLTHLTILLNRTPERQTAFETLLREQQDPRSPNFHRWLTPVEIGEQFGVLDEDIAAVSFWLQSRGLQVDRVSNSRVRVEFSGSAAAVSSAFGASLHSYLVNGASMISPAGAPQIPASLSRIVQSVQGLQSVRERPYHHVGQVENGIASIVRPKFTSCSGATCIHFLWPADFAAIYDVNRVYQQNLNGTGQTIAIIGRARVYLPDIENFQQLAGLPVKDPTIVVPPAGIDPGPPQSTSSTAKTTDQLEATIDVTRAGSVAPGATILLIISADAPTVSGISVASEYAVDSNLAKILSISFGGCEQSGGQAAVLGIDSFFSQASAQGISIIVASGDTGAAGCDESFTTPPASQVASPSAGCSSSYVTCVGGTQFADVAAPSSYWTTANSTGQESAAGYIPEGAWNEPRNGSGTIQAAASGGGVSAFIPTPSWQTGLGVPGAQGRYSPDVSFSASMHDGYAGCFAALGSTCAADSQYRFSVFYGTSAAAPSMAGIAALLNQKMGSAQGNLNPRLYALAANPANAVFHDVTVATSGVASCDPSVPSMCNNSTPSSTSLTGGLAGYTVGPGYDLVTGLGSIDVANLLAQWAVTPLPGQLQVPSSVQFADQPVGTQSAVITVTITNVGGSPVTISGVTGTDLTQFPGNTSCVTTLQPQGQCIITISFVPSTAGLHSSTFVITSNGIGSPQSFTASGTGSSPLGQLQVPSSISFGDQQVGTQSSPTVVTITNIGGTAVTISTVTGTDLTQFPGQTSCINATLQSQGQCTITTSFAPTTAGPHSSTVAITSNGIGSPQSFTASGTGTTSSQAANAPGPLSGLWWNPNESGWGIAFTQRRNIVFAAWYTYDSAGNPKWYVAPNCPLPSGDTGTNGTCGGSLYQVTGPTFFGATFNSSLDNVSSVGSLTVDFQNASAATMSYTVNGQSRTVAIVRQVFQSGSTPPAVDYTDLWWNPSESGWGMEITQQYGVMFLAWYVYNNSGQPVWYVAPDCVVAGSGCSGAVYSTTGPPFGPSFNPATVQVFTAGTVTVNFSDPNNGTLTYIVNGMQGTKTITRQLF